MSELSPEASKLFAVAREAYSPDDRRLSNVTAAIGTQVGLSLATPSTTAAAAAKAGGVHGIAWISTTKLVGLGLVLSVAGAIAVVAPRFAVKTAVPAVLPATSTLENTRAPSVPIPETALPRETAPVVPPSTPSAPRTPILDPVNAPSALEHVRPRARVVPSTTGTTKVFLEETPEEAVVAPRPTTITPGHGASGRPETTSDARPTEATASRKEPEPVVRVPSRDALAEEVTLVRGARVALDSGNPGKALSLLDQHAAAFPHGTLEQERLAIRVLSLCAVGRTAEARATAAQLKRLSPHSPHLARLGASCIAATESPTP